LTDNGKVFTGRFGATDTEVLFDRICRENGIDHLLMAPRRPTQELLPGHPRKIRSLLRGIRGCGSSSISAAIPKVVARAMPTVAHSPSRPIASA
jgi:hypothetical protein